MPLDGGSRSLRRALVVVGMLGMLVTLEDCARAESTRPSQTTIVAPAAPAPVEATIAPARPAVVATPAIVASTKRPATTPPVSPAAKPSHPVAPLASRPPIATQILSVYTRPSVVHAGDNVNWDVRTTPDIVTVTAHVSAYTIPLHRTGTGRFVLSFAIPSNVPAIFHGTYDLDVTGATTTGATTKRTVSMTFQ